MSRDTRNARDADFRDWALAARPGLRRTAYLLSGDWFLADDLVQDSLVRMYRAWPRVRQGTDLGAYSRRVLVNRYVDHQRRPARREHPTEYVPEDPTATGASNAAESEHREQLLAALQEVPARQRAVLVLRFWEDLSVEQTAQVLGTTTGTVKSQCNRGLAALRAALVAAGLPDEYRLQEQT